MPSANPFQQDGSPTRLSDSHQGLLSQQSIRQHPGYSPTPSMTPSMSPSISEKYTLSADPLAWGGDQNSAEPDDYLHNPDPRRDRKNDRGGTILTARGLMNLGCIFILAAALITLFAGYPIITYARKHQQGTAGAYNLGGINATGQIPLMESKRGLIDPDTPKAAYTRKGMDGQDYELVFSDEFNLDGRTFYPGDDPYWEAVDLHYWGTNNLEWYSPRQVTTQGGSLHVTLDDVQSHNLKYEGSMLSTWNKFCFTGGYLVANISLPGSSDVWGLWPAFWMMGNLGRAGYGASLDGMWPYSYDSCDVGTLNNQSFHAGETGQYPATATTDGDWAYDYSISYLLGQRLSRCTCEGEDHPGPFHSDGSYVGRSAPEIDVLEAQVDQSSKTGHLSMSGQFAPFNSFYLYDNATENAWFTYPDEDEPNGYHGSVFQQSVSGVIKTNQHCYQFSGDCFDTYGTEYTPGNDGVIRWSVHEEERWGMRAAAVGPDDKMEISQRPVPYEPMYILLNQGISENFGEVAYDLLQFPSIMKVDWIRVYQPIGKRNIGCDPPEYPTAAYIARHPEAYANPNLTTWEHYGAPLPKNALLHQDDATCAKALATAPKNLLGL